MSFFSFISFFAILFILNGSSQGSMNKVALKRGNFKKCQSFMPSHTTCVEYVYSDNHNVSMAITIDGKKLLTQNIDAYTTEPMCIIEPNCCFNIKVKPLSETSLEICSSIVGTQSAMFKDAKGKLMDFGCLII